MGGEAFGECMATVDAVGQPEKVIISCRWFCCRCQGHHAGIGNGAWRQACPLVGIVGAVDLQVVIGDDVWMRLSLQLRNDVFNGGAGV